MGNLSAYAVLHSDPIKAGACFACRHGPILESYNYCPWCGLSASPGVKIKENFYALSHVQRGADDHGR